MNYRSTYWWYPFAALLFFFDVCTNAFLEKQFFAIVLCAYVFQLYQPVNIGRLSILALFACLESLIWYGSAEIQLLILIPLTLGAYFLQYAFYKSTAEQYGLLIVALLGNSVIIEHLILGLPVAIPYTIMKISANIFLLWCFSLK